MSDGCAAKKFRPCASVVANAIGLITISQVLYNNLDRPMASFQAAPADGQKTGKPVSGSRTGSKPVSPPTKVFARLSATSSSSRTLPASKVC